MNKLDSRGAVAPVPEVHMVVRVFYFLILFLRRRALIRHKF
jgi:hypothetical protein